MSYNLDAKFEIRDIRNGEWYWVQKEILISKKINASDKLVYSALAYFANNKTQECYPSMRGIANMVGLHHNTVTKSIRQLIKYGFISAKKKKGKRSFYNLLKISVTKNVTVNKVSQKKTYTVTNKDMLTVTNGTTNNTYINNTNKQYIIADKQQSPFKRLKIEKQQPIHRVVYHLEDTLKTRIVNWGKQAKAFKMMIQAGYTEEQIKKIITYMAKSDDFFEDKGFDLMTVANNISRYKAERNKYGIPN